MDNINISFTKKTKTDNTVEKLFNEVETTLITYKQSVKHLENESKKKKQNITREYKNKLRQFLNKFDNEPLADANLIKPTEEFEDLTEKSKEINIETKKEIQTIINTFKHELMKIVNSHKKNNICRVIPCNGYIPIIEFDIKSGNPISFFVLNSQYEKLTNFEEMKEKDFTEKRPNFILTKKKIINLPPFFINSMTSSPLFVNFGINKQQDELWLELIEYLKPF